MDFILNNRYMVNKWANNLRRFILLIIDTCYTPFHRLIPIQTFRYAATGGFNTLLDISLYFICYNFILDKHVVDMGIVSISPHIFAFLMVFPITFLTGFLLAKYITFSASEIRGRTQFMRYILSVSGSIFLNYVFIKIFVEFVGLWPTLAKVITTIIVVIYSYFVQKFYTFKTTRSLAL